MSNSDDFYIYTLTQEGNNRRLASPLPSDFANHNGLCSQALAGEFLSANPGEDNPESFTPNPEFIRFLQWSVAKHAPTSPGFVDYAEQKPDGPVFIVDVRALHHGQEPQQEDLIGVVMLEGGKPIQFKASPDYQVLTKHGFLRIDPWLREKYIEDLQQHALSQRQ